MFKDMTKTLLEEKLLCGEPAQTVVNPVGGFSRQG
jgi:hypothetical protein